MKQVFKCDCEDHLLEISYYKATKHFPPVLSFELFELHGQLKKLKNPKCIGGATIYNNKYPKEMDKLINFLEKVIKLYKQEKQKNGKR